MRYAYNGSLANYITNDFKYLKWKDKIKMLHNIVLGLNIIHQEGLIHHDFHSGNILHFNDLPQKVLIGDLGLSNSTNQEISEIIGVLPYIAPEVLNGKPYTQKSDIYSFGILMSEISTGQQPFNDKEHDIDLAFKICEGLRPGFSNNTPDFYIKLSYKCMDANPDNRPTDEEILKIITFWKDAIDFKDETLESNKKSESNKERLDELRIMRNVFNEMDNKEYHTSINTAIIHPGAVYTSRLLKFTDLPQPLNSNKVTIIDNHNGNYLILLLYINFVLIKFISFLS